MLLDFRLNIIISFLEFNFVVGEFCEIIDFSGPHTVSALNNFRLAIQQNLVFKEYFSLVDMVSDLQKCPDVSLVASRLLKFFELLAEGAA